MGSESTPWRDAMLASQPPNMARGLQTLYNRQQLEAVLHRERARADRNRMEFSLVLFRSRGEELRATVRLARMLLKRSRGTDELGWFDSTCVAVLLPYTSAEGARAFAENALRDAQEELVPAICRIYTYPSAWYFEDDLKSRHHAGNGDGHANGGNEHAGGDGNGNGHGNGNDHDNGNRHPSKGTGGAATMTSAPSAVAT